MVDLKKPYEISLWQDENVYYYKHGGYVASTTNIDDIPETGDIINTVLKESKIVTIGSNTMDTPIRAIEPELKEQVNGNISLTFKMYSRYYDPEINELVDNPYIKLMVNERKVKLRYGVEDFTDEEGVHRTRPRWYDFIIKSVVEDSEAKTFTYTCNGQFISELSKNGFSLVYDTTLENNMGSVTILGESILDGTEWYVDKENCDFIHSYTNEVLYEYKVHENPIIGRVAVDYKYKEEAWEQGQQIIIPIGSIIYIGYNSYNNNEKELQFFYPGNKEIITNDNGIILNLPVLLTENFFKDNKEELKVVVNYQGNTLVKSPIVKLLDNIDEMCYKYKREEKEYYVARRAVYLDINEIKNLLENNALFQSLDGWSSFGENFIKLTNEKDDDGTYIPKLDITFSNLEKDDYRVFNNGFYNCRAKLSPFGLIQNERYIFEAEGDDLQNIDSVGVIFSTPKSSSEEEIFNIETDDKDNSKRTIILKIKNSKSYNDILDAGSNLKFYIKGKQGRNLKLKSVNFYKYEKDSSGNIIRPNNKDINDLVTRIKYYFFTTDKIQNAKSLADIAMDFTFYSDEIPEDFEQLFTENYEKITTISASKSNRFNLIQKLCETFEVWVKFNIEHEYNGEIKVDYIEVADDEPLVDGRPYYIKMASAINYKDQDSKYKLVPYNYNETLDDDAKVVLYKRRPRKSIVFKEYIGKEQQIGFRYGMNLKGIKRTINSDQIVSKLIVEANTNQFGQNSFCTIQRSKLNPLKENFIYNFNYFLNNNLLKKEDLYADLYGDSKNIGLNYFSKVSNINKDIDEKTQKITNLRKELANLEANYTLYSTEVSERVKRIETLEQRLGTIENSSWGEKDSKYSFSIDDVGNESTLSISGLNTFLDKNSYYVWQISNLPELFNSNYYISVGLSKTQPNSDYTLDSADIIMEVKAPDNSGIISRSTDKYLVNYDITSSNRVYGFLKTKAGKYYTVKNTFFYSRLNVTTDNSIVRNWIIERDTLSNQLNHWKELLEDTTSKREIAQNNFDDLIEEMNQKVINKKALNESFFNKYSRFILEGSWTSADYYNDDIYYTNALKVSYGSAFPQITYTITVLELSGIPEFEKYQFSIGDKTFIEDVEFFGYVPGTSRPYREDIVISETKWDLDDPSKNTLTVKNYRTQFEDLFQRITATTQSLQFNEGKYNLASSMVNPDGTINASVLGNSLTGSGVLNSAIADEINSGGSAFNLQSQTAPNNRLRITAAGIQLSSDNGQTWTTAIGANGINADAGFFGEIRTDKVTIYGGETDNPTFMWNKWGLNAYYFEVGDFNEIKGGPYLNKFVRFDRFGLYGYNGTASEFYPRNTIEIQDNTIFSLTWNGLRLNAINGNNYLHLSTNDTRKYDFETGKELSNDSNGLTKIIWAGTRELKGNDSRNSDGSIYDEQDNFRVYSDGSMMAYKGIFGGEISAGRDSVTKASMEEDGFTIYYRLDNEVNDNGMLTYRNNPLAKIGWMKSASGWALPYMTFGIGDEDSNDYSNIALIKKYGNGLWIGNGTYKDDNSNSATPKKLLRSTGNNVGIFFSFKGREKDNLEEGDILFVTNEGKGSALKGRTDFKFSYSNGSLPRAVSLALEEEGYLEKSSSDLSYLYDKTANAGRGNCTKYWYELGSKFKGFGGVAQGQAWCAAFVDWCLLTAYAPDGDEDSMTKVANAVGSSLGNGRVDCEVGRQGYISANRYSTTPQVGAQIYFRWSQDPSQAGHTGFVYAVGDSNVYTIEGNTSDGVYKREYSITDYSILGYGMPDYGKLEAENSGWNRSSELSPDEEKSAYKEFYSNFFMSEFKAKETYPDLEIAIKNGLLERYYIYEGNRSSYHYDENKGVFYSESENNTEYPEYYSNNLNIESMTIEEENTIEIDGHICPAFEIKTDSKANTGINTFFFGRFNENGTFEPLVSSSNPDPNPYGILTSILNSENGYLISTSFSNSYNVTDFLKSVTINGLPGYNQNLQPADVFHPVSGETQKNDYRGYSFFTPKEIGYSVSYDGNNSSITIYAANENLLKKIDTTIYCLWHEQGWHLPGNFLIAQCVRDIFDFNTKRNYTDLLELFGPYSSGGAFNISQIASDWETNSEKFINGYKKTFTNNYISAVVAFLGVFCLGFSAYPQILYAESTTDVDFYQYSATPTFYYYNSEGGGSPGYIWRSNIYTGQSVNPNSKRCVKSVTNESTTYSSATVPAVPIYFENTREVFLEYKPGEEIKGVDVSYANGYIDWAGLRDYGVKYAILRIGHGQYSSSIPAGGMADEWFFENVKGAKAAGIILGGYWFTYMHGSSAEEIRQCARLEAQRCLEIVKQAEQEYGEVFKLPIYLDYEGDTITKSSRWSGGKTTDDNDWINCMWEFYQVITVENGRLSGLYSATSWWNRSVGSVPLVHSDESQMTTGEKVVKIFKDKDFDYWAACWNSQMIREQTYFSDGTELIPGMWQYSGGISVCNNRFDFNKIVTIDNYKSGNKLRPVTVNSKLRDKYDSGAISLNEMVRTIRTLCGKQGISCPF